MLPNYFNKQKNQPSYERSYNAVEFSVPQSYHHLLLQTITLPYHHLLLKTVPVDLAFRLWPLVIFLVQTLPWSNIKSTSKDSETKTIFSSEKKFV